MSWFLSIHEILPPQPSHRFAMASSSHTPARNPSDNTSTSAPFLCRSVPVWVPNLPGLITFPNHQSVSASCPAQGHDHVATFETVLNRTVPIPLHPRDDRRRYAKIKRARCGTPRWAPFMGEYRSASGYIWVFRDIKVGENAPPFLTERAFPRPPGVSLGPALTADHAAYEPVISSHSEAAWIKDYD